MELYLIIGLFTTALIIKNNKLLSKPILVILSSLFLIFMLFIFVDQEIMLLGILSIICFVVLYLLESRRYALRFLFIMTIGLLSFSFILEKEAIYGNASTYISTTTINEIVPIEVRQATIKYLDIVGIDYDYYTDLLDNEANKLQMELDEMAILQHINFYFDAKKIAKEKALYFFNEQAEIIKNLEKEMSYYNSLNLEEQELYKDELNAHLPQVIYE